MISIRYVIFEIVLIKVNSSEKEGKEKQGNLKMVMQSNSPSNNSAFPLVICEQLSSTEIPDCPNFNDYPNLNAKAFLC